MVEQIVIYVLNYIGIIFWMWGICQINMKKKKIAFIYVLLALLILCFIVKYELIFEQSIYSILIVFLIQIALNCIIFEGNIIHNMVKSFFSIAYIEIIYFPVRTIYSLLKLDNIFIFSIFREEIISIVSIFCIYFLGLKIKTQKRLVRWIQNIPIGYFVIGFFFAFTASGISDFVAHNINDNWSKQVQITMQILQTGLTIFLYFFGIAIAFINLMKENYKEENLLKDKYLEISKKHYSKLKEHINEVQKIRHDMNKHMQIVSRYLEQEDYKKANEYLNMINEHMQWQRKPIIDVGNDLVNAILNNELEILNPEIVFQYEGILPPSLEIQEFDLCTLFSNLLSNSIEACEKLSYTEKIIILKIQNFQNQIIISLKNPIEENIKTDKLGKFSSKKDNFHHGYGISNIRDVVEKYNGLVEFFADNNWFEVRIYL